MLFKRLSLATAVSLLFVGQEVYSKEPDEQPSRVASLAKLSGKCLFDQIKLEEKNGKYDMLNALEELFNTNAENEVVKNINRKRLSDLVFDSPYRCTIATLNPRFIPYLKNIDLGSSNLGAYLAENQDALEVLTKCPHLRTLNLAENDLGEHVRHIAGLPQLTVLNVAENDLGEHIRHIAGLTQLTQLRVPYNNLGEHVSHLAGLKAAGTKVIE